MTAGLTVWSACVFELGELVEPGAGGGGFGGAPATGGAGGVGADGGGASVGAQRTQIDVDGSALTGSHDDFPVLVTLGPDNIDYARAGTDGADIRFYAEDGTTLLAHDVERWVVGDTSHVWVTLPTIDPGAAVIWLHAGAENPPSALPPEQVWLAYAAVYHLDDQQDATVGQRHGQAVSIGPDDIVEGRFALAHRFQGASGATPHINLGDDGVFAVPVGGVLTAELWFQRATTWSNPGYMLSLEGCCLGWGMAFVTSPLQLRNLVGVGNCCNSTSSYSYAQPELSDPNFDWHHAVAVMDRANGINALYIDGVLAESAAIGPETGAHLGELHIGSNFTGEDGFDGSIDEVRISTRSLSADWIALQYAVMTGSAVTVGTPEDL